MRSQPVISGSDRTQYRASGEVTGWLLNQFSMDEHKGNLRVASTDSPPFWDLGSSESLVTVLAERNGRLEEVGRVGGLGKGEQIQAVRFLGDLGYVVTFRQVDPLYVVDLSDQAKPRVAGELKILGYSAYLHPLGENLLLGVGQDATKQGAVPDRPGGGERWELRGRMGPPCLPLLGAGATCRPPGERLGTGAG